MKRTLLLVSLGFMLSSNVSFSQMTSATETKSSTVANDALTNTTALKPADGQPSVFSSQESLESTVPKKISALRDQIAAGKLTEAQVINLRQEIWRFENAIVATKSH